MSQQFVSFVPWFNVPELNKLKFFGERRSANCGGGGWWWVLWICRVQSGSCCWSVQHVTLLTVADKPLSTEWWCRAGGFIAVSKRGRWRCSLSPPSLCCDKEITSLTVGQCGIKSLSWFITVVVFLNFIQQWKQNTAAGRLTVKLHFIYCLKYGRNMGH